MLRTRRFGNGDSRRCGSSAVALGEPAPFVVGNEAPESGRDQSPRKRQGKVGTTFSTPARPLTADESVMSRDSLVFNARAGYRKEKWDVYVELLNLFDTAANDIEYYYESRLPGEPVAGIADTHYHPMEPFTLRTGVAVHW